VRILFVGSVYFSKVILEKLINLNAQIIGVITKNQSVFNSDFNDLSQIAQKNNIPWIYVKDINSSSALNWINKLYPDIIFCFGWSNLIKKDILKISPMGVLGFHPAMLPKNRGRHPLIWAKILGLNQSGTTFFFMDEGADSGDILDQKEFEILFQDDASDIYKKMIKNAIEQIESFLPKLINGNYATNKQLGEFNTWRKRNIQDGLIDFRMTSELICNLVRGLSKPYIGAHCVLNGVEIKVWEVELSYSNEINSEPGKVLELLDKNIKVKTANGAIILKNHNFKMLPDKGSYIK